MPPNPARRPTQDADRVGAATFRAVEGTVRLRHPECQAPAGRTHRARRSRAAAWLVVLVALAPGRARPGPSETPGPDAPAEPPAATARGGAAEPVWVWRLDWDEGLEYELARRLPRLRAVQEEEARKHGWEPILASEVALRGRVGGRLHLDTAGWTAPGDLLRPLQPVGVRRLHVYTRGEAVLLLPIDFKIQFGWISGAFLFDSGWVRLGDVPWIGTVTLGYQDAPVTLDALVSSSARTFLEAATPVLAFASGTRLGIQAGRPLLDERATFAVGVFTDVAAREFGDASDSITRLTFRATGLPWWRDGEDAPSWVHVGLSGSFAATDGRSTRYRARPETYLTAYALDTGDIDADGSGIVGLEAAAAAGPLFVQGEVLRSTVDSVESEALGFFGLYLQAAWALTGETHPYDRRAGLPTRLVPTRPFSFRERQPGAIELGARFSYLDLDDGPVEGGTLGLFSAVANWTWDEHVRFQVEGHAGWSGGGRPAGAVAGVQARVQIDY